MGEPSRDVKAEMQREEEIYARFDRFLETGSNVADYSDMTRASVVISKLRIVFFAGSQPSEPSVIMKLSKDQEGLAFPSRTVSKNENIGSGCPSFEGLRIREETVFCLIRNGTDSDARLDAWFLQGLLLG